MRSLLWLWHRLHDALYFDACTPGADVLCVETVANPMQIYPQQNLHIVPPADEIKFLLTIR